MEARFVSLGRWIADHARFAVVAWGIALAVASFGARALPDHLIGGSGAIPGSVSARVAAELRDRFDNPYTQLAVVALDSPRQALDEPAGRAWIAAAETRLRRLPQVRETTSWASGGDRRLLGADRHHAAILVGLRAVDLTAAGQAVPVLRDALSGLKGTIQRFDPAAKLDVTGNAAYTYDINQHDKVDGQRAEGKALPLTLVILVAAFGALVAAALPLTMGLVTTTVTLGLADVAAHLLQLSDLLQNVVTMIGLALGIDYALLLVDRFREALATGATTRDAVAEATGRAGPAIVTSGLTVLIGLVALEFSPVMEARSIALGGSLVVVVSVLAAVSLLPALLSWLGPRVDAPRWLSRRLRHARTQEAWRGLASWVMQRPVRTLVASLFVVGCLAAPATRLHTGFPSGDWLPTSLEARSGAGTLYAMGNVNALLPIDVVVHATDGRPVLDPGHLGALLSLADRLKADPRVGQVLSPVTLRDDLGPLQYAMLYADLPGALERYPQIGQLFLSRDRSAALFRVIPANRLVLAETQALGRDIGQLRVPGPLTLEVGGDPVYYTDFDSALGKSYPLVFGFVILATLAVLFAAFRSYLLPVKAVLMNLLSVAAGYGAVTAVFQLGWLQGLFGRSQPLTAIPLILPMMMFCIVFGLSMDYEVFLLSRISEAYRQGGDNTAATAEGLAATGRIITSAAAIMVVVFGAFAFAEMPIIQMLGLGLAVAVLVDATFIRVLTVPALMRLFGDWNWVPGVRRHERIEPEVPNAR